MAVIFPDLAPTPTSNSKNQLVKIVRLANTNFVTGGATTNPIVLPANATINSVEYWKGTQFSGGSVSAVTLSIGVVGNNTFFASAIDVLAPAAGTLATVTPMTNIMQGYQIPQGSDISMTFTGTATTGNPTAGAIYVTVYYVL